MTAMMPALAVTALLHDRATASAIPPTRGVASAEAAAAGTPSPAARSTARPRRRIPAGELRLDDPAVVRAHL